MDVRSVELFELDLKTILTMLCNVEVTFRVNCPSTCTGTNANAMMHHLQTSR